MHNPFQNKGICLHSGLLFVFPAILLAFAFLYIRNSGLYFTGSVDPEYGYLLNGLLMANGKIDIQFITNPGIPIHYIVALVSVIFHLFRPGLSLTDDVLMHPEIYIRASLYFIAVLNAGTLYYTGKYALKKSENLLVALFIQLAPFTHLLTLQVQSRLMPEAVMCLIVCCWIMITLKMYYEKSPVIDYNRYSIFYALLFSIGIADKLTFLPYLIMPLIVLPNWKFRLKFTFYSLSFYVIIAFPVTLNYKFFVPWVSGIFIHTGSYGSGDTGIIHWTSFITHLRLLLFNSLLLSITALTATIIVVLYRKFNYRSTWHIREKIVWGIVWVVVMQFIFTAKHFAFHYMVPSLYLTPLMIFVAEEKLSGMLKSTNTKIRNVFYGGTMVLLLLIMGIRANTQLMQMKATARGKMESYKKIQPLISGKIKYWYPPIMDAQPLNMALPMEYR